MGDNGFTSLTSLHLNQVAVSGDSIEFLLSKCHHLERLHVGYSELLVRLNVVGLSCKSLKQLAIDSCGNLEQLEIDDVNLTHFDYIGWNHSTNLVLKSMPMLVNAAFGGTVFRSKVSIFQQISHLAASLYKLSLDMSKNTFPGGAIPRFCNLKHLNMVVGEPLYITPLLEACPVLHGLKLEINSVDLDLKSWLVEIIDVSNESDFEIYLDYFEWEQTKQKTRPNLDLLSEESSFEAYLDSLKSEQIELKTHPNLKLLEVIGFRGYDADVDVTVALMLSACNLETITFSPYGSFLCDDDDDYEISRTWALKLQKVIPSKKV